NLRGEASLVRGIVVDGEFKDLRLCFRCDDWAAWLQKHARRFATFSEARVRQEFRKWASIQSGRIFLRPAWRAMQAKFPGVPRDMVERLRMELPAEQRQIGGGRPPSIPG